MELNLSQLEDQHLRLLRQIQDAEDARDSAGRVAIAQFDDHRERVNEELAQLRKQLTWIEREIEIDASNAVRPRFSSALLR